MSAIESPVKDRIAAIIDTGQEVSAYRNRKMVIADCYEGRTTIVTQSRQVTYLKVKAPEPRLGCTILFWLLSAQIWYQMVIYQDSLSSHRKIVFDLQRWPESRLVQRRTIVPNLL